MGNLKLHNEETICITKQKNNLKMIIIAVIIGLLCFGSIGYAYNCFSPEIRHSFEKDFETGTPELKKNVEYSTITVSKGYEVKLCAVPKVEDNNVFFYLTNPKSNNVWFKVEILDEKDNVIGSTDVIKQDQHIPSIELSKQVEENMKVKLRIISYKPHTWESCGNVNLKITLNTSQPKNITN